MTRPTIHFVGFKDDRYWNVVKVWGKPDFYHIWFDKRALRDFGPDDIVIFATGEHDQEPKKHNAPDMIHGPIHLFC